MRPTSPDGTITDGTITDGARTFSVRAMATDVRVQLIGLPPESAYEQAAEDRLGEAALDVFRRVERACTRFDPASPLMRANSSPYRYHAVPTELFEAVRVALRGYEATRGVFDPRVLADLVSLGYDRTLAFGHENVRVHRRRPPRHSPLGKWKPSFRGASEEVQLGRHPIDLGGVGKGLAIRWAAAVLEGAGRRDFAIEAGGDCHLAGRPPGQDEWLVGVEDPLGQHSGGNAPADTPHVALLGVSDMACATSSKRLRRWQLDGSEMHHLIDPSTGLPGGTGLVSVTVVAPEADWAEIWSKTLLLSGVERVKRLAERKAIAALWVDDLGRTGHSRAMAAYMRWRKS